MDRSLASFSAVFSEFVSVCLLFLYLCFFCWSVSGVMCES